jgi:hypothetical protein
MVLRLPAVRKRLILAFVGAAAAGLSLAFGNPVTGPLGITAALILIILMLSSLSTQALQQNNRTSADISKIWESQQMDNERLIALESASSLYSTLIEKIDVLTAQVADFSEISHIDNKFATQLNFEQMTERQELLLDLLTTVKIELDDVKTRIERLSAANKVS